MLCLRELTTGDLEKVLELPPQRTELCGRLARQAGTAAQIPSLHLGTSYGLLPLSRELLPTRASYVPCPALVIARVDVQIRIMAWN